MLNTKYCLYHNIAIDKQLTSRRNRLTGNSIIPLVFQTRAGVAVQADADISLEVPRDANLNRRTAAFGGQALLNADVDIGG
jgi:hypothetical protein